MSSIKDLQKLIEDGQSLKLISQALGEIAAVRLNRIKVNVERNRLFFGEIAQIYYMVKLLAKQRGIFTPSNSKTISVLLTSNSQFSGRINNELSRYFVKNTKLLNTDRIVVGKTGLHFLAKIADSLPFKTLTFAEDLPSYQELKSLADAIRNYQQVLVYFTSMKSTMLQIPAVVDITASAQDIKMPIKELSYIFEPEIKVVLEFFDTQINILLLEQALLESELSRVANRLVSMSEAEHKAEDFLKEKKGLLSVSKRSLYNLKLLDSLIHQIKIREQIYGR